MNRKLYSRILDDFSGMTFKPRKGKSTHSRRYSQSQREENHRRRVIHWAQTDNASSPTYHNVPNYDRLRISSNADWTTCRICLGKMFENRILTVDVLADYEEYQRRKNMERYRPV